MDVPEGKIEVTTKEEGVLFVGDVDVRDLEPCTHEEADSRIMLHVGHGYQFGMNNIIIHVSDTDVVVLDFAMASDLPDLKLWLAFGNGNYIYQQMRLLQNWVHHCKRAYLLLLVVFSGCDTVSFFLGIEENCFESV